MKTHRATAKRFKKTGGGHFKYKKAGLRHGMFNKSRKRLRSLRKSGIVDSTNEEQIRKLLPYA